MASTDSGRNNGPPRRPAFGLGGTGRTIEGLAVRRVLLTLVCAGSAAVASAPAEEEPFEVFSSMPGPFFFLSDGRTVVDHLVTVRASPEAFPPEGNYREVFEVEIDLQEEGPDINQRVVFGRLARVAPDGINVVSSTVAQLSVPDRGTMVLIDEQGFTQCDEDVCIKRYVVRFIMSGLGFLDTQWFIRAGVDWARNDLEVPEEAELTLSVRLL